jgi:hypothetical protein
MESFKATFSKELPLELDRNYPTHVPVETMMRIVFEASRKADIDGIIVLRHFQFTEKEIGDFFGGLRKN